MQKPVVAFLSLMLITVSAKTEEYICCEEPYVHRLMPIFSIYGHIEDNYNFLFPLLGLEYSLEKYDGIDFRIAFNAGFKDQSAFIYDYVVLGYNIPTNDCLVFCPLLSFENTDHFFKNHSKRDITFVRNRFLFGLKIEKIMGNIVRISITPELFKDFDVCAYFFRDAQNFWGRRFHYPIGYKANGVIEYFTSEAMDVILGGFYLETFTRNYKEYGASLGLAWNF